MKPNCECCNGTAQIIPGGFQRIGKVAKVKPHWRRALEEHYQKFFGSEPQILHESESELVHLDVNVYPANERRPFHTLITQGISDKRCYTPKDLAAYRHFELMMYLPKEWDWTNLMSREEWRWTVGVLKSLGRYAHKYSTFFTPGHSVAPCEEAFAPGSLLDSVLFVKPADEYDEFNELVIGEKPVSFMRVVPVTAAEVQYKVDFGIEPCLQLLYLSGGLSVVDPYRDCALTCEDDDLN